MNIINISYADFCEDNTTIELEAESNDKIITFFVQTNDGEYRPDLGCWIEASDSSGDILASDYPDFDLNKIISKAENFINSHTIEDRTKWDVDGENIYIITNPFGSHIVTLNHNFINSDTSSYQRKFSNPIMTFESKNEAIEYLDTVENFNDLREELERN